MTERQKQAAVFKAAMKGAAVMNHHILQNIPEQVYEDALFIYSNQEQPAVVKAYVMQRCRETGAAVPPSAQS